MCLAACAIGLCARFPIVLLANRDESFERAAAPMAWWPGPQPGAAPDLLAGTDLSAGGTWLGLSPSGRLALVTNVREPGRTLPGSPSRGALVTQWLRGAHGPLDVTALQGLGMVPRNGFNLLVMDLQGRAANAGADTAVQARWLSNRPQLQHAALGPGVHAVSNAALDTPWPKLVQLKLRLQAMLSHAHTVHSLQSAGLQALADPQMADDAALPATGLTLQREHQLSAAFIRVPGEDGSRAAYGTRCSTVVVVQQDGPQRSVHVLERSFDNAGHGAGDVHHTWVLPAA
jgi:uncharacterized protein with NRDE domain